MKRRTSLEEKVYEWVKKTHPKARKHVLNIIVNNTLKKIERERKNKPVSNK